MSEQNELKPCPFCEYEVINVRSRVNNSASSRRMYFCRCPMCHTEGPRSNASEDAAIAAWNRRVADERKTDEQIRELALVNGFKLKEQPDGTMSLNPYVYDFARELMGSATIPDATTGEQIRDAAPIDERAAFDVFWRSNQLLNWKRAHPNGAKEECPEEWDWAYKSHTWEGWQARALMDGAITPTRTKIRNAVLKEAAGLCQNERIAFSDLEWRIRGELANAILALMGKEGKS